MFSRNDPGALRRFATLLVVGVPLAACAATPRSAPPSTIQPPGVPSTGDTRSGPSGDEVYRGHAGGVVGVAWSPSGSLVASAGDDHTDQVWRPGSSGALLAYRGHDGYEFAVAWSPTSTKVVSAGADGTVQVWRPYDGAPVLDVPVVKGQRYSVAWSPDARSIAVGGDSDGDPAVVIDARSGKAACSPPTPGAGTVGVAFSPDSRLLAVAAQDGTVGVFDAADCRPVRILSTGQAMWSVAFSPDGHHLAGTVGSIGGPTGPVRAGVIVWDLGTAAIVGRLAADGPTYSVTWTPDGAHVVYAGGLLDNIPGIHDDRVWIGDLTGSSRVVSSVHHNTVWSVSLSPAGRAVASASQDATVAVSPVR